MSAYSKFHDLKMRVGVSLITLTLVGALIFFSYYFLVQAVITLLIGVIAVVGIGEFAEFCKAKGAEVSKRWMMVLGALEVLAIYLGGIFPWAVEFPLGVLLFAIFVFFCLGYKQVTNAIPLVSMQFFAICYIAVPLALMLKILYPGLSSHFNLRDGRIWFVYLICITKVTDIGAYFGGRLLGKRKLAPILSPSKTIEGAVAGLVFAVGLSVLFSFMSAYFAIEVFQLPLATAILLGVVLSVGGQLGDLAESLLKRDAKVKDSNRLPGLGGVLDMFDSLLFTIPILFFYLHTI
ncbi:MAG: CDP-archaeol synthase [Chlamydiae bacterium]|nr:CDP-archaeol synthase [Chlamydiota bacterium]